MADFAQLHHRIWQNLDFTDLSIPAQLLYLTCLSHPTITLAGVLDWRPTRIAQLSTGWTPELVEDAGHELEAAEYLVIDWDTEEAFVRSFYRNDGIMKQRNLATGAARAILKVASRKIHRHMAHELHRLHDEFPNLVGFDSPELWQYMTDNPGQGNTHQGQNRAENEGENHPKTPPPSTPPDPPKTSYPQPVKNPIQGSIHPSNDPSIDPSIQSEPHPSNVGSNGGSGTLLHPSPFTIWGKDHSNQQGTRPSDAESGSRRPPESLSGIVGSASPEPPAVDGGDGLGGVVDPAGARCERHRGLPAEAVPPCRGCQAARVLAEEMAEKASSVASERRREAIRWCTSCDEFGWLKSPSGALVEPAVRCDHSGAQLERLGLLGLRAV